ncbi:antibiotic biosynthesis monooxygenase [Amycolatopsis sp. NBC_00345]|uniref:antibiotic biosynthesis monooxygenase family protein n=1 Tax=Amycolatopsis sp. NBC_00345 TaxID=2975955 RepID=UPI002E26E294
MPKTFSEEAAVEVKTAKGFRGTRLHRAIDADAPYPLVNVARWDSAEDMRAAVGERFTGQEGGPVSIQPALYRIVHDAEDPQP